MYKRQSTSFQTPEKLHISLLLRSYGTPEQGCEFTFLPILRPWRDLAFVIGKRIGAHGQNLHYDTQIFFSNPARDVILVVLKVAFQRTKVP